MRVGRFAIGLWVMIAPVIFTMAKVGPAAAGPVDEKQLIDDALEVFKAMEDYTCKLDKRVRQEGVLYEDLSISVKYKKPTHYYFRWEQGHAKGREVIFVSGKYDDRLVAHPGGEMHFLTLRLDPQGRLAMKANRHSLRCSGMEKIFELIEANYALAEAEGIDGIRYAGEGHLDGQAVWVIEGIFPPDRGFYAHKVIISIAQTIKLPVSISIFDWSDELVEEYIFHDLRINVGLTEYDFSPGNPEYNYFRSLKR